MFDSSTTFASEVQVHLDAIAALCLRWRQQEWATHVTLILRNPNDACSNVLFTKEPRLDAIIDTLKHLQTHEMREELPRD